MNLVKKISTILIATSLLAITIIPTTYAQEPEETSGITPDQISNIKSEGFTIVPTNPNTINPRKFLFEIKPGETTQDYATITNLAEQEVHYSLYGADPTFSAQGTPAYKTRQDGGSGEGSWIQFTNPQITLQPGEIRVEQFTVSVPNNAELGEYRAGITMEKSKADINNPNITIATRVILHSDIKVTTDPQPIPKQDGSFLSSAPKEEPSWQVVYFWISLGLFTVSFVALIIVTYQERKKKAQAKKTTPKPKKPRKKTTSKTKPKAKSKKASK